MILSCIDPRMQEPVHKYTVEQNLTGKFSQFVIAGAAIGVVAPSFKDWHKAFWDNLGTSIQLHHIKKVIAIDHRDCGAAKIAYGEAKVANPQIEFPVCRGSATPKISLMLRSASTFINAANIPLAACGLIAASYRWTAAPPIEGCCAPGG